MPGDVHDVVHATEQPEVAVAVTLGAVAREVDVGVLGPVLLHVPVGIAPDAAQHPGPRLAQHEIAGLRRLAGLVEHLGVDAGERSRGRARLERGDSGQRRDEDVAGLRLPPRVHHRAAAAADDLPVPDPRLGIDRLADGAEQAQAREVAALRVLLAPFHERADRRRGRVADRDAVLLDDPPEAVFVREVGRALVHDGGRAVRERPVHDVGVAGHPADVRGAPVDVVLVDVEDPLVGGRDAREVAARGVDDAFRLARRARRVEEVEEILGVHRLGGAPGLDALDEVVPPDVAPGLHADGLARPLEDDDALHARALLERLVGVLLERHRRAPPVAAVGRDHERGVRVVDAIAHRLGREAAEDHRVRGADPGARQHGDRHLGDHRHVDGDAVALLHAVALERGGEALDFAIEIPVGQRARVARLPFPDQGGLGAMRALHVAVETVVGDVELAAHEPLGVRRLPLERLLPRLEPGQLLRALLPEPYGVPRRLAVDRLALHERSRLEGLRRRKLPVFLEERLDRLVAFGGLGHVRPHAR